MGPSTRRCTMNNRFTYSHSSVYGWCVYDRERGQSPAYDACCELLPPVKVDESGTTCESPVMLRSEYAAMRLCSRLNLAHKRAVKSYVYSRCPRCGHLMRVEVNFPSPVDPFIPKMHTCEECGCKCIVSDPHKYNSDGTIQEAE